ncbi:MAG TPA: metal-sulfur cluster assembly factor [Mucilaginibacter sp.]|nr:metal-sulfur cluster assembly factor [Mucilaginibacter sp.]
MNVVTNNDNKCTLALLALKDVLDPEIGLNVVDLGLIYRIDFNDDTRYILVIMTFTTQFCPMGQSILDDVILTMEMAFRECTVKVDVIFDPPWSMQLISEEGRKFLNR